MHNQAPQRTLGSGAFICGGRRLGRLARRGLVILGILALLGNVLFAVLVQRWTADSPLESVGGQSESLVAAKATVDTIVVTANRANTVTLLVDRELVTSAQFDVVIGDIAISPGGARTFVGTSDGIVTVLDEQLAPLNELGVEGRVVSLATTGEEDVVVGHGVGAFGDRFWVSYFPDATADPAFITQVDFTISGLAVLEDLAVYGTQDSRVGAIALDDGERLWTTTLRSPVTQLAAMNDSDAILAGSENGDVALLDEDGNADWIVNVSSYTIRGLGFDASTNTYIAGDARGNIFVLDADGEVTFSEAIGTADIQTIAAVSDGTMLLVPRDGSWYSLDPSAIDASRQLAQLRTIWLTSNIMLGIAAIASAIMAMERLSTPAGQGLRRVWQARLAYAFLLPAVALIIFFAYYPSGLAFYYSLTNFSLRSITEFIGLENYRRVIFEDTYFRTGMLNMGIIIGTSILKTITIPLLVAQLVFWLRNSLHQYFFRTMFILPAVVPDLVFTLMWQQVYDPNTGFLNQLLASMGLSQYQRAWLGDEQTALWAVIGVGFPFVSAFAFLIFLGGLLNINPEYFDAAKVDGARWWSRFFHIDAPLLLPQFRILLFFAIIGTVQGFASIFILTRGGPGTATYVPALQMYMRISDGDFGYASAIGVVLFVIILLMTLFILRFRRNEAIES
jgi:ABC-type sugar transport system permease subunit/outer membrane protein assembly factor BamB